MDWWRSWIYLSESRAKTKEGIKINRTRIQLNAECTRRIMTLKLYLPTYNTWWCMISTHRSSASAIKEKRKEVWLTLNEGFLTLPLNERRWMLQKLQHKNFTSWEKKWTGALIRVMPPVLASNSSWFLDAMMALALLQLLCASACRSVTNHITYYLSTASA